MRAAFIALTILVGTSAAAQVAPKPETTAAEGEGQGEEETAPAPEEEERGAEFTFAFAGGALVPQGSMGSDTEPGLDVWGRVGWITPSGLGLVMHLEYAPLRRTPESVGPDEVVDAHLFAATAGPRFTVGRNLLRAWVAGGAGVMVQRTETTAADLSSVVETDTVLGVSGGGGVDVYFLGSGGVTLAGAYTRGMSKGAEQQYVSLNAGLVFVY